ncbi:MAG: hypothetical protein IIV80_02610, partial [Clostridia bacterium]|nr:hypothetical protein [Clostridia bacterium]
ACRLEHQYDGGENGQLDHPQKLLVSLASHRVSPSGAFTPCCRPRTRYGAYNFSDRQVLVVRSAACHVRVTHGIRQAVQACGG